jgi:hypothetical protein
MTNSIQTTAIVLVATVGMNMIGASAFAGAAGKHFPHASIPFSATRALPAPSAPIATQSNQSTSGYDFSYKPQNSVVSGPVASPAAQTSFGWDVRTSETRLKARAPNGGLETTTPTPVVAPTAQTPEWPCGTVATGPNAEVVAASTTC